MNPKMLQDAKRGTLQNGYVVHPMGENPVPIELIRRNLRLWENNDLVPRPDDVFQERLYCIRWVETYIDEQGREQSRRHYAAPSAEDWAREATVLRLLQERFADLQAAGYIPSRRIEPGDETSRLFRERGWTHWHHLFTPRQLLVIGAFGQFSKVFLFPETVALQLVIGRFADWNSKLSVWLPSNSGGLGGGKNTFLNQALNTIYNFSARPFVSMKSLLLPHNSIFTLAAEVQVGDARSVTFEADIWITDPPYADAINYEEISVYWTPKAGHLLKGRLDSRQGGKNYAEATVV